MYLYTEDTTIAHLALDGCEIITPDYVSQGVENHVYLLKP